MTRVFLGKDTETQRWFESGDLGEFDSSFTAGSILHVATDGTITELRGAISGQVLVWNAATETWEVSAETLSNQRRLLEEILLVLLQIRDQNPDAWFTEKITELAELVNEQVQ